MSLPQVYRQLSPRGRAVVAMSILTTGEQTPAIFAAANEHQAGTLQKVVEEMLVAKKSWSRQELIDEIKRLHVEAAQMDLTQIHPQWLVATLAQESPEMIAVVLRYLPPEVVNELLDLFNPDILISLPAVALTFQVKPEVALYLRGVLERSLPLEEGLLGLASLRPLGFLAGLNPMPMAKLLHQLGIDEMAKAFKGLDATTTKIILRRLPTSEAEQLKKCIKGLVGLASHRVKQAQSHMVLFDFERFAGPSLISALGVLVLSKAMTANDQELLRLMQLKLALPLARYLEELVTHPVSAGLSGELRQIYQKEIAEAAQGLQGSG